LERAALSELSAIRITVTESFPAARAFLTADAIFTVLFSNPFPPELQKA